MLSAEPEDFHNIMERIALFIDGANVYAAAKRLGWNFDHRRILEHFSQGAALNSAFYYTALPSQPDDKQKRFIDALTYMGYTVRTRPLRESTDEYGEVSRRASVDVALVTDLLITEPHYDVAVLLTGDGDFERPVEVLRARGKRVVVACIPEMTSYELRNAADEYVDLRELRAVVERPGYRLPSEGGAVGTGGAVGVGGARERLEARFYSPSLGEE